MEKRSEKSYTASKGRLVSQGWLSITWKGLGGHEKKQASTIYLDERHRGAAWPAQSVELAAIDLRVTSSSPTFGCGGYLKIFKKKIKSYRRGSPSILNGTLRADPKQVCRNSRETY